MEQRRSAGHDHWFYESQTRPHTHATAPLVPEAAYIEDRFLLGLQQEATALQPLPAGVAGSPRSQPDFAAGYA